MLKELRIIEQRIEDDEGVVPCCPLLYCHEHITSAREGEYIADECGISVHIA